MSRHDLPSQAGHTITVGWDQPLMTYFCIVKRLADGEIVEWLGTDYQELYDLDDLVRAARPYTTIPGALLGVLYDDRDQGRMG